MKKKLLAMLLCAALTLGLAACTAPAPAQSPSATPGTASGLYTPGTYTGTGEGKNGPVEVTVTFTADAIEKVEIGSHTETAGISDPVFEQYPAAVVEGQTLAVDTIAGATITCDAVLAAVADAVKQAGGDPAALQKATGGTDAPAEQVELTADVVVVGAGSAGALAALSLAEQGKSVILLEKMAFIGGSSAACGGGLFISGTQAQMDAGIESDAEAAAAHIFKTGHDLNDPALVPILANQNGPMLDWLVQNYGVEYTIGESDGSPFGHYSLVGGGSGFMKGMKAALDKEENIDLMLSTEAKELVVTDGTVTGVKAVGGGKEYTISGKAVILTTGGFSCNEELIADSLPGYAINYGPTYLTGDGHRMAMDLGGQLIHPEWIAVKSNGIETSPRTGIYLQARNTIAKETGAILVNKSGVRVVKEEAPDSQMVDAYLAQEDQSLYMVMDQAGYDIFLKVGESSHQFTPEAAEGWLTDEASALPVLVKGDDLAAAAAAAGVDGAALGSTVAGYNKMVEAGEDTEFGHAVSTPLGEGPYYILKLNLRYCQTLGGMAANGDLQLLGADGKPIPGLYGAGELVGGVFGDEVISLLTWAMTSGYHVGETVGAAIK